MQASPLAGDAASLLSPLAGEMSKEMLDIFADIQANHMIQLQQQHQHGGIGGGYASGDHGSLRGRIPMGHNGGHGNQSDSIRNFLASPAKQV